MSLIRLLISLLAIVGGGHRGTGVGNFFSRLRERASLQGLDRVGALAENLGDLLNGEVSNNAQNHDVALVGRELPQQFHRLVCGEPIESVRFGAGCPARVFFSEQLDGLAASAAHPELINESAVGNGEHERPKAGSIAAKVCETIEDDQKHLARQVVRFTRPPSPEKTGNRGSMLGPEPRTRPARTSLCREQHGREGLVVHGDTTQTQTRRRTAMTLAPARTNSAAKVASTPRAGWDGPVAAS